MKKSRDSCEDLFEGDDLLFKPLDSMEIPSPSTSMEESFSHKLERINQKEIGDSNHKYLLNYLKVAVIALVFACGWFVGSINNHRDLEQIQNIQQQLDNNNKLLVLALINQSSVSDRLLAANVSFSLSDVDNQIISALVKALENDPDPNVKIKCAEALAAHLKPDSINRVFGNALEFQTEPLIQLVLIDYLRSIGDAESNRIVKKFIGSDKVDEFVKSEVKKTFNI